MKRAAVVLSLLVVFALSTLPAGAETQHPSLATPSPAASTLPAPSAAPPDLPSWLQAADEPAALPPAGMTPAPVPACIIACLPHCVLGPGCRCVCF